MYLCQTDLIDKLRPNPAWPKFKKRNCTLTNASEIESHYRFQQFNDNTQTQTANTSNSNINLNPITTQLLAPQNLRNLDVTINLSPASNVNNNSSSLSKDFVMNCRQFLLQSTSLSQMINPKIQASETCTLNSSRKNISEDIQSICALPNTELFNNNQMEPVPLGSHQRRKLKPKLCTEVMLRGLEPIVSPYCFTQTDSGTLFEINSIINTYTPQTW